MNELTVKMSDVMDFFCRIKENPATLFEEIRENITVKVADFLNGLMGVEITLFLGRGPYERGIVEVKKNYRNGYSERTYCAKGIGKLSVRVPRDRNGEFRTSILPRYQRHEEELSREIIVLFLAGLSTRNVELISRKLLGFKVSKSYVSQCSKQLTDAVNSWRERSLSEMLVRFMYVDGVNFDVRIDNKVEVVPVLVAVGVDTAGFRHILGFQAGDKESAGSWREFFKDLKRRGLDPAAVELGIMDGLPGLEKVFREEFHNADVQRCQVHVARNVIAKVPRAIKKDVADDMRSIFYASSKLKAMKFFKDFKSRWEMEVPSAVKCLEKSLEQCLTYLKFDECYWSSLRTTNPIERVNKEFKRRTKPMEILAGEANLYNILSFVSIKMEMGWSKSPIQSEGKKLKKLLPEFTQKS